MSLILLWFPLISFMSCVGLGRYLGQEGSSLISCLLLFLGFLFSWFVAYKYLLVGLDCVTSLWSWVPLSSLLIKVTLTLDKLSILMLTVVFTVSFLVHWYSTSYMWGDPHLPRFMSYLSLFTFFMVLLVQANNLPLLFIGWEGVGLCSYLLVNFWYTRMLANTSAIKAMLVNRVGDLALILAMGLIWAQLGGFEWTTINQAVMKPGLITTLICVLLLVGAAGKSAQLGLHTWLPDAMEGPTPVSALIHAATMVTAGVFLILRCAPLFESTPTGLVVTLLLGSVTALFAASTGLAQTDIKKVIAYSTTSQLGYMVASCGLYQFTLGFNHLINHAYFKALLFLSAGAIIHTNMNEQDLRRFGGLWATSPITLVGITIGSISLMGFPFMTGFYSKDLILEISSMGNYPYWANFLLLGGAGLTAAYSVKIIILTFINKPLMGRKNNLDHDSNSWSILSPLIMLSIGNISVGFIIFPWVNFPLTHPLLDSYIKVLPLGISILSVSIISWIYSSKVGTKMVKNPNFQEINSFLFYAWQFNLIINHLVAKTLWSLSHHHLYKLVDRGWVEELFPKLATKGGTTLSKKLSLVQSGEILNYIAILIVFFTLVATLTY
uniref:NADH-ubiquinone oxidoreductase chain 5 n=1 Tax=Carybdea alata TaxID=1193083 RepID=X4YJL5_CARAL|nr:NADH dehydrogenase subunit 5 [Alatina alata]